MYYTEQIKEYLVNHIKDPKACITVTSVDKLPTKPTFPLYLVINEDISTLPGSHWVCIFINERKGENKEKNNVFIFYIFFFIFTEGIFLDSFARKPMPAIAGFLEKHSLTFEINEIQLQKTTSSLCGVFCAVALVSFSQNKTLKEFLSNFSYNRFLNDIIIQNMSINNAVNKFHV